jgi:EPS-associated MarR family transcriptional regulator
MVSSVQSMNTLSSPTDSRQSLEFELKALDLLQDEPAVSQREMAQRLDVSLGKVNYCLRALLAKGLVKAQNFKNSQNKLAYAYVLTPAGIKARADLTAEFLKVKVREYEILRLEIERLKVQAKRLDSAVELP